MGRYVRAIVRRLAVDPRIDVSLLVRDVRDRAIYRQIAGDVAVAPTAAARERGRFAAVWYPWNAMRFEARAPAMVTINDDFAFRYPARDPIARWREQAPIRRAVARAAQLVTISTWSRATLIERFTLDPRRIDVIPLGPDPFFSPGSESAPFAEPFFVVVGAREERKNVAFLLAAFARAFTGRAVRLAIVGELDAPSRRRIGGSGITLSELGSIDDDSLRRLYRTAVAVTVPSLAEGFGLVAVEAQACGAAVLAADASALPEAVGDAGILLDPTDSEAWIAALRTIVDDDSFRTTYRARSLARRTASAQETTDAILTLLERTIDHAS